MTTLTQSPSEEIQEFLDTIRVKSRTKTLYGQTLRNYVQWSAGSLPKTDLEAQAFINYREGLSKKPATVRLDCSALLRYLLWKGISHYRLEREPVQMLDPKHIDIDQVQELLKCCDLPLIKCVTALLYDTAARIGEVMAIKMSGVEWEGFLSMRRKGGRVDRVPTSDWGLRYLREWVTEHRRGTHPLLFGGLGEIDEATGQGTGYKLVLNELKTAARRAGLPAEFTPHWLRHSRAIHLRDAGVDWVIIADQLGHVNPAVTMRIYGRRTPENVRERVPAPELE